MKHLRILASALALAIATPATKAAVGDTFTINQLTYTVLTEDTLNAAGTVSIKAASTEVVGLITIPDIVQNGDVSYMVTSVPESAFANCNQMTGVQVGANVTSIAYKAFISTPALASIAIDEGNTFYNSNNSCNAVVKTSNNELIAGCKNTVVNSGVKTIGQYAFYGCTGLTSVAMPSSVTAIGNYAFYGCSNLSDLSLSDNITTIGQWAFYNCAKLTSFTFPSKTKTVGAYTFYKTGLEEIDIPNTITKLKYDCTFNSDNLKKVAVHRTTPLGINKNTFNTNGMLVVPDGAKQNYANQTWWKNFTLIIEEDELDGLNNIIEFEDSNAKAVCVSNWDFNGDGELSTAEAEAVKSLGASFSYKNNITSFNELQYFTGLTQLNDHAFHDCKNLQSVKLPESITVIGSYAFYNCDALTSIVLPANTQQIKDMALNDMDELAYVETEATTPPTTTGSAFWEYQQQKLILVVPDGTAELYRNANYWERFGVIIEKSNVGQLNEFIVFEDENVKNICVQHFDFDKNGEISIAEAASIKNKNSNIYVANDFDLYFRNNTAITSFNELGFFTALTEIPARAFEGCTNLTSIQLPSSLESIGDNAFQGSKLASLDFPDNVSSIGSHAFDGCSSIQGKLTLPSDNTVVKDYAFRGCKGVTELEIPEGVTKLGMGAFQGCSNVISLVIPSTMEIFGRECFHNCTGLQNVVFRDSENKDMLDKSDDDTIEYEDNRFGSQFAGCTNLETVTIPNDFTILGTSMFSYCAKLTNINIPDAVTEIPYQCFQGCETLEEVILPEHVTVIGGSAFRGCKRLETVNFPQELTWIGEDAFAETAINNIDGIPDSCSILTGAFHKCNLTSANIKDTYSIRKNPGGLEQGFMFAENPLTEVTYNAKFLAGLENNSLLTHVTIGDNVEEIDHGAFANDIALRVVKIPNSVKTIGIGAFYNNRTNAHVTLPSWLENVSSMLVRDCPRLSELTLPAYVKVKDTVFIGNQDADNYDDVVDWAGSFDEWQEPSTFHSKTTSGFGFGKNVRSLFVMGNTIPADYVYPENMYSTFGDSLTFYVKKSVYDEKYPNGLVEGYYHYMADELVDGAMTSVERVSNKKYIGNVAYDIPVTMENSSGGPLEYKTLCRDFDVDLTHTNDNLPEGVRPLRAYLVDDVDGENRLVFLNEIKYIPSRLKANTTDVEGNRYKGVDEYVGVILRGTPGHTYHYRMGEHDYTQGTGGQWLMGDAMVYSNSTDTNNLLAGDANDEFYVYKTIKVDDGEMVNYGLNNNRFKIYYKDGWLYYNKAYLQLPKDVSDAVERVVDVAGNANLTFVFNNADGSTDRVSSVEFNRNSESGIFYNPYGQRVNANTKGVVIHNGKKFVNR